MRAPKTLLLALTTLALSLALGTATASATAPDVTPIEASGGPTELSFSGEVNPNGLATSAHFDFFAIVNTDQCYDPNPLDLLSAQSTDNVPLDPETSAVPVSGFAIGLPYETEFCFRLVAQNDDGTSESPWGYAAETTSPLPEFTNLSFDGGSDSISYSGTLTPNTGKHSTSLLIEYFEKPEGTCDDFAGEPTQKWNDNPDGGWNGWSGYSPVSVSGLIDGLQPNHTYCIRVRASGYHGDSNTTYDWTTITTVQPVAASVANVKLAANANPSIDAALKFDLDDHGAGVDTGIPSTYSVYVFDVGAGRCTPQDYFGGDQLIDINNVQFSGEEPVSVDMDNLTLGTPYCATIVAESAWGDSYDTTVHVEVGYGAAPQVSGQVLATIDHTRLGGYMTVNPGHLVTDYGVEYFPKGVASCTADALTPRESAKVGTMTTNLAASTLKTFMASDLTADTTYCMRGWAENSWGRSTGTFAEVITAEQPPQAEIGGVLPVPTTTSGMSAALRYHANDMGAYAATANQSVLDLKIYYPSPADCGVDMDSLTPVFHGNTYFAGDGAVEIDVPDLTAGSKYCVRAFIKSAWIGSDVTRWDEFVMPAAPSLSDMGTSQPSSSSLKIDATLAATWLDTDYELHWHKLTAGDECPDAGSTVVGSGTTTGTENASAKSLTNTITGLAIGDVICWRYGTDNRFGDYWNDWEETTIVDVDAPTKPTGLTFSNVTQTSATLSWTVSDNVGVDYLILKDPVIGIANPTGTSTTVSLTCGQSKTFKLIAVDTAGNSSEPSDPATVTAAACTVPGPPDTPQPKQCFNKYSKKISGKSAKGKKFSAAISGKPSADGQSITFTFKATGKGAGGAKAGFASSRTGKTGKAAKRTDDTPVFFKYANGKKFKTLVVPVTRSVC